MSPMPTVSYSITIRLEFAARSAAVSDITARIENRGATVTALDVSASGPERMRADITVLTAGHDLRLLPPLTITMEEIDKGLAIMEKTLA